MTIINARCLKFSVFLANEISVGKSTGGSSPPERSSAEHRISDMLKSSFCVCVVLEIRQQPKCERKWKDGMGWKAPFLKFHQASRALRAFGSSGRLTDSPAGWHLCLLPARSALAAFVRPSVRSSYSNSLLGWRLDLRPTGLPLITERNTNTMLRSLARSPAFWDDPMHHQLKSDGTLLHAVMCPEGVTFVWWRNATQVSSVTRSIARGPPVLLR
ncbi:hypothetical protein Q8A67_021049 [Cirrhinus molitorella]|uniref:Uncharacterized protein n=1 Tax=Cirrhinus molitorella TaxID=172907 RepID=A0AA88P6C2_9TELE|nr:hypothetical protein Q8A67_021049 [Cirrhinus molitorella]